ncbi:EAL domain-containing protein [Ectobacillus polymachus]|uniref:bifunctional diguanylate cyclase/phosphodiesterase n=1 Tax=Ectobacillus polymachus TaxID=1508806 RepID=UPI003A8C029E
MGKQIGILDFIKKYRWDFVIPLLLLIVVFLFDDRLYRVFGASNYVMIHLMIEIMIIVACFSIAIQAWLVFPYILSNYRLYIGALFLALGLLEIMHTISYKGMPFFLKESSTYSATWFYIIGRLTQVLGLLFIFTLKQKKVHIAQRWLAYSLACLFVLVWVFIIYYPYQLLPNLVIDGVGTTVLKNGMQYLAIVLQCALILYLFRSQTRNDVVIIASIYLILGDSMFTVYKSVYDIRNFIGHLFQLMGYYFLIRAFYYASVEKPFQVLMRTRQKLEKSREKLHHMAYHDELTELPNSRFLIEKLKKELKLKRTKKAIMIMEINRLNSINESLGHSFRDLMLQKVAVRLRESLPSELFMSKLRAGEFTIIINSVENKEDVVKVCNHIQDIMKEPVQLQHFLLKVTLNIGIAMYPDHGENETELLKHAQIAMREAQKVSELYMFYHSKMKQQFEERLALEHDLYEALDKREFYLEYQPQVEIITGCIDSVEALIRWKHPKKGWISPATFIPIAEETGLIVPIGKWVLETACKQAKQWHEEGISNIRVAVNLSIRQFFQQNLVQMVEDILERTNLSPNYLELEITESMTMDTNHAIELLHDLKRLGVKIAVDDFGTGYSSMSYLKDFPIDCLKIDRSFVCNVQTNHDDAVLISMIISMAKHLKLKVIAEGVEDIGQFSYLAAGDCDTIQGYLFSKPISAEALSANFDKIQNHVREVISERHKDAEEESLRYGL